MIAKTRASARRKLSARLIRRPAMAGMSRPRTDHADLSWQRTQPHTNFELILIG